MQRKPRARGRLMVNVNDQLYRVELREDGIHIREKWSRRPMRVSFSDLVELAAGQRLLRL